MKNLNQKEQKIRFFKRIEKGHLEKNISKNILNI